MRLFLYHAILSIYAVVHCVSCCTFPTIGLRNIHIATQLNLRRRPVKHQGPNDDVDATLHCTVLLINYATDEPANLVAARHAVGNCQRLLALSAINFRLFSAYTDIEERRWKTENWREKNENWTKKNEDRRL